VTRSASQRHHHQDIDVRESRTTIRSAQAVAEHNALQAPIEYVIPGVVHAGEIGEIVPLRQADQRALVRAAVDHR
jgi:hypothetical protein